MDNNRMFELAEQLVALRDDKARIEDRLKKLNKYIEETEYKLSETMALSETQNFTRQGMTIYLTTRTRASAVAEVKEELYAALKAQGFSDLVYETVNANALSAFVKEQIEENKEGQEGLREDALPDWLMGLVNVYEKTTVGIRKAAK